MGTVQQDLLERYKRNQVEFKRTARPILQLSELSLQSEARNHVCALIMSFWAAMAVLIAAHSCYDVLEFLALCLQDSTGISSMEMVIIATEIIG